MPALLGAVIYIVTCYFLCRSITDRFSLQFPIFVCLVFNPFILDFMVAARGYSLANAFLADCHCDSDLWAVFAERIVRLGITGAGVIVLPRIFRLDLWIWRRSSLF